MFSNEIAFGLFCVLGWGIADFLAAKLSRKIGSHIVLFWMQVSGLLFLFAYLVIVRRRQEFLTLWRPGNVSWLALSGLLQGIGYMFFYAGLEKSRVALVSSVASAYPLIVVLVGVSLSIETLDAISALSTCLIFCGVMLSILSRKESPKRDSGKNASPRAMGYALPTMLCWGFSLSILSFAVSDVDWMVAVLVMRVFMVLFCGLWAIVSKHELWAARSLGAFQFWGRFPRRPHQISILGRFRRFLGAHPAYLQVDCTTRPQSEIHLRSLLTLTNVVFIGILDISAFLSYSLGVRIGKAIVVAPISAAYPALTSLLAHFLLKEGLTRPQIAGVLLVMSGMILLASRA